jgi:hypothetical protein
VLLGGEFSGGEASSSQGSYVADSQRVVGMFFFGEILVGSSDTEAVSLAGDIFPLWRTLWHPFLKVLLGT